MVNTIVTPAQTTTQPTPALTPVPAAQAAQTQATGQTADTYCCFINIESLLLKVFPKKDDAFVDPTQGRASVTSCWPSDPRAATANISCWPKNQPINQTGNQISPLNSASPIIGSTTAHGGTLATGNTQRTKSEYANAIKENGALISNMAETVDNATLNTISAATNSLALAGAGLEVIGTITRIQKLLTATNTPKTLDITTLTTIKTKLESDKDIKTLDLEAVLAEKTAYIQKIQHQNNPNPDFATIRQELVRYADLIHKASAELDTLNKAIKTITQQLAEHQAGHDAEIRRHSLETATDCGSLVSALATTLHHALNPLGIVVATTTLIIAIDNTYEAEMARRHALSEIQRLERLIQQDSSVLRPLLEAIHSDTEQEAAALLEERQHHLRESFGATAILGGGIAAITGFFLVNIGFAAIGAGTLVTNNIMARMRQKPEGGVTLSLLDPSQSSNAGNPKPRLSSDIIKDLHQGKEEHVALLADYLGTEVSSVRLGLKHCGMEKTLRSLGSSANILPT